jgi:hypothetical protein
MHAGIHASLSDVVENMLVEWHLPTDTTFNFTLPPAAVILLENLDNIALFQFQLNFSRCLICK